MLCPKTQATEDKMFRPDIKAMFIRLNDKHFDGEIPNIPIVWNARMTTTAGYCRYRNAGQVFSELRHRRPVVIEPYQIDMSDKLFEHLDYDLSKIERTMIHEMVHAYLVHKYNEKGHTARFQRMMTRITGEYKNHRCHSYDTVGIKRKQERKVKWECSGCPSEGWKVRMPKRPHGHICRACRGTVTFVDMSREPSNKIFWQRE
jgi:predicted SprT family Zn-dependent metalloprotease